MVVLTRLRSARISNVLPHALAWIPVHMQVHPRGRRGFACFLPRVFIAGSFSKVSALVCLLYSLM